MHLHMFSQGARVRVRLIAASHFAIVRLVAGVHVRVLFSVAAVRESSIASFKFAFKRLFTYEEKKGKETQNQTELDLLVHVMLPFSV